MERLLVLFSGTSQKTWSMPALAVRVEGGGVGRVLSEDVERPEGKGREGNSRLQYHHPRPPRSPCLPSSHIHRARTGSCRRAVMTVALRAGFRVERLLGLSQDTEHANSRVSHAGRWRQNGGHSRAKRTPLVVALSSAHTTKAREMKSLHCRLLIAVSPNLLEVKGLYSFPCAWAEE